MKKKENGYKNKSNIAEFVGCDQDWIKQEKCIQLFQNKLIIWGRRFFRPFPWRLTHNPYKILIAETMLHRTQVTQVLPVYKSFIKQYPNIKSLATASRNELSDILWPLGLKWRNDLIFEMAHLIATKFNMNIPKKKEDLVSLPGISEYIACAIRCFSWNIPEPIIDTNTIRIIGRLLELQVKDSSRRNIFFREKISLLVDHYQPRVYNYALIDLAHAICLIKQPPKCNICPVIFFCRFGQSTIELTQ